MQCRNWFGHWEAFRLTSGGASTFRASLLPGIHPIAQDAAYPDWWIAACVASVAEIAGVDGIANRYRYHGANMGLGATAERQIKIHAPEDFEGMRKAGRLAAEVLDMLVPLVKAGVTTEQLDKTCHDCFNHTELEVVLEGPTVAFRELMALEIDHVVRFDYPLDRPLRGLLNGDIAMEGQIVNTGRKPAFRVTTLPS